ncbi:MAG: COG2426 family protein [Armatimonadota bacterium]
MWRALFDALKGAIPPPAVVALLSAAPISEVRGGIPGGLLLRMPLWQILPIAIAANVLTVIPILLWFNPLADWLMRRGILTGVVKRLIARARAKKPLVDKHGVWALTLFVAIPLPATGAWSGAMVAAVFEMSFWRAVLCITVGVIIASAVVTLLCFAGKYGYDAMMR